MIERPELHQVNLCHYRGHLRGEKSRTWAAISTCNGTVQGVLHDGQQLWHLHPVSSSQESQGSHHLYQHSHQHEQNYTCGYQDPPQSHHRPKRDIGSKPPSANGVTLTGMYN